MRAPTQQQQAQQQTQQTQQQATSRSGKRPVSQQEVLGTVKCSDDGEIKFADVDYLLNRLIVVGTDTSFMGHFLYTFNLYMKPTELLDKIIERFNASGTAEEEASNPQYKTVIYPQKLRIFIILNTWIEKLWNSSTEQVLIDRIKEFCGTCRMENPSQKLRRTLERKTNTEGEARVDYVFTHEAPAPVLPLEMCFGGGAAPATVDFGTVPVREMARQMALVEQELFRAIKPWEFQNLNFARKDKSLAPNVHAFTAHFNAMNKWFVTCLMGRPELGERIRVMEKLIELAEECSLLQNYNGVNEIISACTSSAVFRLHKTWGGISPSHRAKFNELTALMASAKNYAVLRKRLHNIHPPCVPYIGIYQTDLTFIEEGNPTLNDAGLVNWQKCKLQANIIIEIQTYQQTPYCLTAVPWLHDFFATVDPTVDENEMWNISMKFEPREKKPAPGEGGGSSSSSSQWRNGSSGGYAGEQDYTHLSGLPGLTDAEMYAKVISEGAARAVYVPIPKACGNDNIAKHVCGFLAEKRICPADKVKDPEALHVVSFTDDMPFGILALGADITVGDMKPKLLALYRDFQIVDLIYPRPGSKDSFPITGHLIQIAVDYAAPVRSLVAIVTDILKLENSEFVILRYPAVPTALPCWVDFNLSLRDQGFNCSTEKLVIVLTSIFMRSESDRAQKLQRSTKIKQGYMSKLHKRFLLRPGLFPKPLPGVFSAAGSGTGAAASAANAAAGGGGSAAAVTGGGANGSGGGFAGSSSSGIGLIGSSGGNSGNISNSNGSSQSVRYSSRFKSLTRASSNVSSYGSGGGGGGSGGSSGGGSGSGGSGGGGNEAENIIASEGKKRWFVLLDHLLLVFNDSSSNAPKEIWLLDYCTISLGTLTSGQACITVRYTQNYPFKHSHKGETLIIAAPVEPETRMWFAVLVQRSRSAYSPSSTIFSERFDISTLRAREKTFIPTIVRSALSQISSSAALFFSSLFTPSTTFWIRSGADSYFFNLNASGASITGASTATVASGEGGSGSTTASSSSSSGNTASGGSGSAGGADSGGDEDVDFFGSEEPVPEESFASLAPTASYGNGDDDNGAGGDGSGMGGDGFGDGMSSAGMPSAAGGCGGANGGIGVNGGIGGVGIGGGGGASGGGIGGGTSGGAAGGGGGGGAAGGVTFVPTGTISNLDILTHYKESANNGVVPEAKTPLEFVALSQLVAMFFAELMEPLPSSKLQHEAPGYFRDITEKKAPAAELLNAIFTKISLPACNITLLYYVLSFCALWKGACRADKKVHAVLAQILFRSMDIATVTLNGLKSVASAPGLTAVDVYLRFAEDLLANFRDIPIFAAITDDGAAYFKDEEQRMKLQQLQDPNANANANANGQMVSTFTPIIVNALNKTDIGNVTQLVRSVEPALSLDDVITKTGLFSSSRQRQSSIVGNAPYVGKIRSSNAATAMSSLASVATTIQQSSGSAASTSSTATGASATSPALSSGSSCGGTANITRKLSSGESASASATTATTSNSCDDSLEALDTLDEK